MSSIDLQLAAQWCPPRQYHCIPVPLQSDWEDPVYQGQQCIVAWPDLYAGDSTSVGPFNVSAGGGANGPSSSMRDSVPTMKMEDTGPPPLPVGTVPGLYRPNWAFRLTDHVGTTNQTLLNKALCRYRSDLGFIKQASTVF